jgi:ribosome-binding protein aMBF1 (putative translation factor)
MPKRPKTGFHKFFDAKMKNAEFAASYKKAKQEIDAVDRIIRALDSARLDLGMTKADLARRISAKPEIVRRLLTGEGANPTMATVVKLAEALNLRVELVPEGAPKAQSRKRAGGARKAA